MGTWQKRIDKPEQFPEEARRNLTRKVTIILKNNTVLFGKILRADATSLQIENMRRKRITVLCNKIQELYFDSNF